MVITFTDNISTPDDLYLVLLDIFTSGLKLLYGDENNQVDITKTTPAIIEHVQNIFKKIEYKKSIREGFC